VSDSEGSAGSTPRPDPPYEAPPGDRWTVVADDPRRWQPAGPGAVCRFRGSAKTACGQPAVVRRLTGVTRMIWWNYDLQHADGRWVENGKVVHWELEEDPDWHAPK
jgi:hypothetical protein